MGNVMKSDETELLTVTELADFLHMDVGTIRNRLSRGDPMPPSCSVGRRRLFPRGELDAWLKERLVSNDESAQIDV